MDSSPNCNAPEWREPAGETTSLESSAVRSFGAGSRASVDVTAWLPAVRWREITAAVGSRGSASGRDGSAVDGVAMGGDSMSGCVAATAQTTLRARRPPVNPGLTLNFADRSRDPVLLGAIHAVAHLGGGEDDVHAGIHGALLKGWGGVCN